MRTKKVTVPGPGQPRVRAVHVPAVPLYNLRADDAWWRVGDAALLPDLTGALVKLEPPTGDACVTEADVAGAVEAVKKRGAVAVRVVQGPRAAVHVAEVPATTSALSAHKSVRQVVEAMVEEARTDDREALRARVEAALAAGGL